MTYNWKGVGTYIFTSALTSKRARGVGMHSSTCNESEYRSLEIHEDEFNKISKVEMKCGKGSTNDSSKTEISSSKDLTNKPKENKNNLRFSMIAISNKIFNFQRCLVLVLGVGRFITIKLFSYQVKSWLNILVSLFYFASN